MTRTVSAELADALAAQGGFAMALCAEVTRTDEQVYRFTSWDRDLSVEEDWYDATNGVGISALDNNGDAAVDQMQFTLLLSAAAVTESDVLVGKWNGAQVRLFLVNADDTAQGVLELRTGWLGNISVDRGIAKCEFLGIMQHFQSTIGEVVTQKCLNEFCGPINSRGQGCGLDIDDFTETGTVTDYDDAATIGGQPAVIVYSDDLDGFADDYFNNGKITFDTQSWFTNGIRISRQPEGAVVLKYLPPFLITAGMTFTISRGCGKRHAEDCIATYSNGPRFRGFPHLKGNDKLAQFGRRNG